jgi:glutathione S-transferase
MSSAGNELKLLSTWFSPFGSRVKLALHLKGLSYEYVEEDLMNKSQLLLQSNPVHKKVPVLFHRGKALCESMVIVDYIEEAFPDAGPRLLPSDPYERAVARFWVAFIENKVRTPIYACILNSFTSILIHAHMLLNWRLDRYWRDLRISLCLCARVRACSLWRRGVRCSMSPRRAKRRPRG